MSKEINETNETIAGVGTYVFKNPTKIDGEEVTEIKYDFTAINGAAIRRARTELGKRSYIVSVPELDQVFHAALFAEAVGLTLDNVEAFSLPDYMNVTKIAGDFLTAEG